jgi:hypothetical protein
MTIEQNAPPCARKGCTCEVAAGQTYCSPACANASTEAVGAERESCRCGHAQCHGGIETVAHETRSAAAL